MKPAANVDIIKHSRLPPARHFEEPSARARLPRQRASPDMHQKQKDGLIINLSLLLSPIDYRLTYPSPSPVGTLPFVQLFAPD